MVNKFILQCLEILENEEVKGHCKNIARPFIEMFFVEIMPYIYFVTFFLIISFIINLAIFYLLIKKKHIPLKI